MSNEIQKPFLKWVGGKSQNIKHFINKIPNQMNNYYEPFLGGGSVLFTILSLQKDNKITITNKIYASDINEGLIYLYKNIQNNYSELFSIIESFMNDLPSTQFKNHKTLIKFHLSIGFRLGKTDLNEALMACSI